MTCKEHRERCYRLSGGKPDDKGVTRRMTRNMRVKVVKNSHELAIGGLKNPVSTRISAPATRLNPLKAMQVVDFPHIEENNARAGSADLLNSLPCPCERTGVGPSFAPMNGEAASAILGRVASLHLHPQEPDGPLRSVESFEAVAGRGIAGDERYFGKMSRSTGGPSRRQVSLMEREQIAEHAATLGLETIAPGAVRANIETLGVKLVELVGQQWEIGEAIVHFYEARKPCHKMDAICAGLRGLMENSRQGVMAEVVKSGRIRVGDAIRTVAPAAVHL